jgi:hypothetical protein
MENESLKPETLKQFLEIDYIIQSSISKKISSNLLRVISNYVINNKEVFYKVQYYKNLRLFNHLDKLKKSLSFIDFMNLFVIKVFFIIKIYIRKLRFKSI